MSNNTSTYGTSVYGADGTSVAIERISDWRGNVARIRVTDAGGATIAPIRLTSDDVKVLAVALGNILEGA